MKRIRNLFKRVTSRAEHHSRKLADELRHGEIDLQRVRALLAKGADPNLSVNGLTALQRAAFGEKDCLAAVNLLLDSGANPFLPIVHARRAWHLSDVVKSPEVRARLLEAEAGYQRVHGPQRRCGSANCAALNRAFPAGLMRLRS